MRRSGIGGPLDEEALEAAGSVPDEPQGTDVESSAPTESGFSRATWQTTGMTLAGPDGRGGFLRFSCSFRLGKGPTMTDREKFSSFLRTIADEIEKGTYPVLAGKTVSVPPSGQEAE